MKNDNRKEIENAMVQGWWPEDDLRRAFVAGAKWWEFEKTGATMWTSDVRKMEGVAELRYPGGKLRSSLTQSNSTQ